MTEVYRAGLMSGQVAIVTGGGSGIGREVARQLLALGARVAICGRRDAPLQESRKLFGAQGLLQLKTDGTCANFMAATCDVREIAEVERFVSAVKDYFGAVHVLVNNAGGQYLTQAEQCNSKGFHAVIRLNLVGTWNMTVTVANQCFIPQRQGRIVNVIAQIRNGFPGMVHTGAARAGVDNLTKTIALEWSRYNIAANCVAPGSIGTDTYNTKYPQQVTELAIQSTPLRRVGTAEEVSSLIVYLASPKCSGFITGQTFYIDGGHSLGSNSFAALMEAMSGDAAASASASADRPIKPAATSSQSHGADSGVPTLRARL